MINAAAEFSIALEINVHAKKFALRTYYVNACLHTHFDA